MPDAGQPTTVEVEVLHFATIPMPYDYAFRPANRLRTRWWHGFRPAADTIDAPFLAFIVRHPTEGVLLVDTGLHPKHLEGGRDDGRLMGVVFGALRPVGPAFDERLRQEGVEPETVERVVMTHLHVDHTSGMRLLPNARFTLARQEWTASHARRAVLDGYVAHHLPPTDRVEQLDLATDGVPHGPLRRTHDLFGDGSVLLAFTPGHTHGHLSVLLRTGTHGEVLLVGDAAYALKSIEDQRLPLATADDGASRDSLRQLRDFSRWNPEATLVPTHDPEAWRALVQSVDQ